MSAGGDTVSEQFDETVGIHKLLGEAHADLAFARAELAKKDAEIERLREALSKIREDCLSSGGGRPIGGVFYHIAQFVAKTLAKE